MYVCVYVCKYVCKYSAKVKKIVTRDNIIVTHIPSWVILCYDLHYLLLQHTLLCNTKYQCCCNWPWSLVVLKDKIPVIGYGLGFEGPVLGMSLAWSQA